MGRKAKGLPPAELHLLPEAAPAVQEQAVTAPEIPVLDELGFDTLEFKCWRCARPDYREKNTAEAYVRNGHKLFCLPCERPDMFEWAVDKMPDGSSREWLRPLSAKETYRRLSPEAHALCAKQALVQILRARSAAILSLTQSLELEYMSLQPAIESAEKDMIEAQALVSAMEHEDVGKKIRSIEQLNADIKRLVNEIEIAKKAGLLPDREVT